MDGLVWGRFGAAGCGLVREDEMEVVSLLRG
jgi:hypothetical protein